MEQLSLMLILKIKIFGQVRGKLLIFFDNKPADKTAWTKEIWVYDYRTNIHHTLKKNPLKLEDLKDFITCCNPENRNNRKETFNQGTNPESVILTAFISKF